jgi:hypothetical protein
MRIPTCFLTGCALLGASCAQRPSLPKDASWNPKSATFAWWGGEVKLPVGFTYRVDQGTDTFQGHFTSPDGKLIVRHDIGGYAGSWAARGRAFSFEERVVEGARVWSARQVWPDGKGGSTTLVALTLPDSGCANFFLMSSKIEDATAIESIARSFRPKGRTEPGPVYR